MTDRECIDILPKKMPYRTTPLITGQIYHVFNRGVEKRCIFADQKHYNRFLKTLYYYSIKDPKPKFSLFSQPRASNIDFSKQIVEIIAYCLMPNHFHLLIKQTADNGISEFMRKMSNSYARYFNTKHNRVGPLWQGQFKAVLVENDQQLIHLSRYIHLNPYLAYLVKDLKDYEWSSYPEYINLIKGFSKKEQVLDFFKSAEEYQEFVKDHADYAVLIKNQLLEDV